MSGYWATGSVKTVTPPARVMMIDSTEAKMGRLMKKLENATSPRFARSRWVRIPIAPRLAQAAQQAMTEVADRPQGQQVEADRSEPARQRRVERVRFPEPVDGEEEHGGEQ